MCSRNWEAPLNHILRNALDHGIESPEIRRAAGKPDMATLVVEARHSAGMLVITVADDGRGIDLERLRQKVVERQLATEEMAPRLSEDELLQFLFLPGFSTADGVTEVSGRGVGLDVVHAMAHAVGGRVRVETKVGEGTCFHLQLPITLSVIRAVIVAIAGEPYAFPHNRINRLMRLPRETLSSLENRQYFVLDGHNVGVVLARQVLALPEGGAAEDDLFIVVFGDRGTQCGLIVDGFEGEQDLVVRPLDERLGKVRNVSAVALLDDGAPTLVLDVDDLSRSIETLLQQSKLARADRGAGQAHETAAKRLLVVDDSITVREVQRQLLVNQGYQVDVAVDGMDGWNMACEGSYDLIITDVDMPRMNGLELVRMVKDHSELRSIPIIIVFLQRPGGRSYARTGGRRQLLPSQEQLPR